ncbi:hypothetical protein NPS70_16280 [Streptomyces sp. C10-9-1]|nr:hypothetical protein [Streptomyces sp. C10-9-1]MCQ6554743.1 hypothetical protein [Streptomyces sp. C10-9-1]
MARCPSLDEYDVQGVRTTEAVLWGDDVRNAVEALRDAAMDGFLVDD